MNNRGIIYRPPFEADSLLLQVTDGCSHNKCTFCYMYHDVPFRVRPMEQVIRDLDEAAGLMPFLDRAFLENGDAFVLSADHLEEIAGEIRRRLPKVGTISMYASILNIRSKTDEELRRLRACGINELNIGVESGYDPALEHLKKGYTAAEATHELARLKEAGIDYGLNIILGCAGAEHARDNAEATADLLNAAQPYLLFTGTLHAEPGCELYAQMLSGQFHESNYGQLLDEQEILLRRLNLKNTRYFGVHPSNVLPMQGMLPKDQDDLLRGLHAMRIVLRDRLDDIPARGGEGAILGR